MSEEEAIKILKEAIELYEDDCYISTDEDFEAIETILYINDSQKRKLIDYKERLRRANKEIEELKTFTREYESYKCGEGNKIVIASKEYFINGYFKENFISKDKIREKIQYWQKERHIAGEHLVVQVLQELLGEK